MASQKAAWNGRRKTTKTNNVVQWEATQKLDHRMSLNVLKKKCREGESSEVYRTWLRWQKSEMTFSYGANRKSRTTVSYTNHPIRTPPSNLLPALVKDIHRRKVWHDESYTTAFTHFRTLTQNVVRLSSPKSRICKENKLAKGLSRLLNWRLSKSKLLNRPATTQKLLQKSAHILSWSLSTTWNSLL